MPAGDNFFVDGFDGERHHGWWREWAGDQPAAQFAPGGCGADAFDFGEVNRREVAGKEVDLRLGEDFAEQRKLPRNVFPDLNGVDDEGEGVIGHMPAISMPQNGLLFEIHSVTEFAPMRV